MNDSGPSQAAANPQGSVGRLIVICFFTAAVIAAGIALLRPLPEQVPPPGPASELNPTVASQSQRFDAEVATASAGQSTASPAAPQDSTTGASTTRAATVRLPRVPVPASVQSLEQEARQVAADLQARYPQAAAALHVGAILHAQLRETEQAAALWQQALARAPEDQRYSVNLAVVAMDRGDYSLAQQTLQSLVDQGNTSADVLHHYALALSNLGENAAAVEVLQQAVTLYPQSADHWLLLGKTQLQRGEYAAAKTALLTALERGAESADLYFQLANAHRSLGEQERAAEYQQRFQQWKQTRELAADQRFQVLSTEEARATATATLIEAAAVDIQQRDTVRAEVSLLRAWP